MALINCPECEKEVSDSAITCPYCGYNIKPVSNNVSSKARKRKVWLPFAIIGAVIITLLVIGLPLIILIIHFIQQA